MNILLVNATNRHFGPIDTLVSSTMNTMDAHGYNEAHILLPQDWEQGDGIPILHDDTFVSEFRPAIQEDDLNTIVLTRICMQ